MAKQFPALTEQLIQFIADQKIFFVGTATESSRVNVSPKGMDSLRIVDPHDPHVLCVRRQPDDLAPLRASARGTSI
jgi:hypothetical protein